MKKKTITIVKPATFVPAGKRSLSEVQQHIKDIRRYYQQITTVYAKRRYVGIIKGA